jgi:tagatose-6-phosphate ketose/aldose isomerase
MSTTKSSGNDFPGAITLQEILQQPDLWPTSLARTKRVNQLDPASAILTGAGTSAYAAEAIAGAWPGANAIHSGDLLLSSRKEIEARNPRFIEGGTLVSVARSGDSPESAATLNKIRRLFPAVRHIVITCNADGRLARLPGIETILLDPRTNDRSLVMTSSFTNLVLAGICLTHRDELGPVLEDICRRLRQAFQAIDAAAEEAAQTEPARIAILTPADLKPLAAEVSLKILEMTAGKVVPLHESFLGLRHGPMSYLRSDSLVVCWLSSDPAKRVYELDLVEELRTKNLGRLMVVASPDIVRNDAYTSIPGVAPELPDVLRIPFEIPFGQLLAYRLSLHCGLDPDNPSPNAVITRVVQGFRLHEQET